MRCEKHGLAAGADGLCVVCRREARASAPPPPNATLRVFGVLGGAFVLVLVGGAIYRARSSAADAPIVAASDPSRASSPTSTSAATTSTATRDLDRDLEEVRRKQQQGDTDMRQALANVRVVVYTTQWCPRCKEAKAWLRLNSIAFDERDVDASPEYSRQMHALSSRSIPTFDIEGEVNIGFNEQWVTSARERVARRKMPPR